MRAYDLTEAKIIKIKDPGSYRPDYVIYKNPMPREVESLLDRVNELRGSVDANNNVYIWEAYKATHSDAAFEIGDINWSFDFVLSTDNSVDDNDWVGLEQIGDYFYNDNNIHGKKNKLLSEILVYLTGYRQEQEYESI